MTRSKILNVILNLCTFVLTLIFRVWIIFTRIVLDIRRGFRKLFEVDEEVSVEKLKRIIEEEELPGRWRRIRGGPLKDVIVSLRDLRAYDEVSPGIYIGKGCLAGDLYELGQLKVTHVLNAAYGEGFVQINIDPSIYRDNNMDFMGIPALDSVVYNMSQHFYRASHFINNAIQNGGVVYVHCHQGLSRSATLVLAHLMISTNVSAETALRSVRRRRKIMPNDGFLTQLCDLDVKLRQQRRTQQHTSS